MTALKDYFVLQAHGFCKTIHSQLQAHIYLILHTQ